MNSGTIKSLVASYYRYHDQCPVIAFEASAFLGSWGSDRADILVLRRDFKLLEIEIKISISDFRKDTGKIRDRYIKRNDSRYLPNYFYFAVPIDMANKVSYECEQLYPYAGVIGVENDVGIYHRAKLLHEGKLEFKHIAALVKKQSGTLCRLVRDLEERENRIRELEKTLKLKEKVDNGKQEAWI